MFVIVFFFVLACLMVVSSASVVATKKDFGLAITGFILSFSVFGLLIFFAAPGELGYGHIGVAGDYTNRLENGKTYFLIASEKESTDYILLVKQVDTNDYFVIRVKTEKPPAKIFTMVDGKPVDSMSFLPTP